VIRRGGSVLVRVPMSGRRLMMMMVVMMPGGLVDLLLLFRDFEL
jgi:hypothetical protein